VVEIRTSFYAPDSQPPVVVLVTLGTDSPPVDEEWLEEVVVTVTPLTVFEVVVVEEDEELELDELELELELDVLYMASRDSYSSKFSSTDSNSLNPYPLYADAELEYPPEAAPP
jgi:hypothetical protein